MGEGIYSSTHYETQHWIEKCVQIYDPLFKQKERTSVIHRNTRLGEILNRSGRFGEEGNLLPLLVFDTKVIEPVG